MDGGHSKEQVVHTSTNSPVFILIFNKAQGFHSLKKEYSVPKDSIHPSIRTFVMGIKDQN